MIVVTHEPNPFRKFNCYRCDTEFWSTEDEYHHTQTGYSCTCPHCGYATYTRKGGSTATLEWLIKNKLNAA